MKAILSIVLACVLSVGAFAAPKETSAPAPMPQPLNFGSVVDKLSLQSNTKLQAKEYWLTIQKQKVNWSGTVYEVQDGHKGRAKIYVVDQSRPLYKGYNIVVVTSDLQKASNIAKGQQVTFTGKLENFKSFSEGASIVISDAQLQ